MAVPDLTALARENPWWADDEEIHRDPHITTVRQSPAAWQPPLPFTLEPPAVYTLRGPRQVGKTTLLKLFIQDLLRGRKRKPRSVLYLDCERVGIARHTELAEAIRNYLAWVGDAQPLTLCLDEVTRVRNWGAAIRGLADEGALRRAVVVATGSHALDLRRGGERMPGRRGRVEQPDFLLLPLSFRDYLGVRDRQAIARLASPSSLRPGRELYEAAQEAALHGSALKAHFDRYLATGGFLGAVAREMGDGRIGADLYTQNRDAVVGEVIRAGLREGYFRELVGWLLPRLGREFTWRDIAGETEIGTHVTARDYVEAGEALYVWHIFHRVKDPGRRSPAFKSPKKLYPADPFIFHALHAWGLGAAEPWESSQRFLADPASAGRVVEGAVADHLRRAYGRNAFYHRSPAGQEIDFVGFDDRAPIAVEVKWRDRVERRDWRALAERGGGLLLTRARLEELEREPPVLAIPVHVLLAIMGGAATLRPVGYAD